MKDGGRWRGHERVVLGRSSDCPRSPLGLLSLPGHWRHLSTASRLEVHLVVFLQAEATRGVALDVRLVQEAGPGGLVLSAGLMSALGLSFKE